MKMKNRNYIKIDNNIFPYIIGISICKKDSDIESRGDSMPKNKEPDIQLPRDVNLL